MAACVTERAFFGVSGSAAPLPRGGPDPLGILRSLARAARVWIPSVVFRRKEVDDVFARGSAAPIRGAHQMPETREVWNLLFAILAVAVFALRHAFAWIRVL